MKKLVYEYTEAIENRKLFANQLVNCLNEVLTRFKSKHNHFGQPISEEFALQLVSRPVEIFDELLRVNSPIKPVAGKPIDLVKLAVLIGIDRDSFISDFTITLPGSVDQFNKEGTKALFSLSETDRSFISWSKDKFVINEQALVAELEAFKVYATEPDQVAELDYWNKLAEMLNSLFDKRIIDDIDANMITQRIRPLNLERGKFSPNFKSLARTIKDMVPVN